MEGDSICVWLLGENFRLKIDRAMCTIVLLVHQRYYGKMEQKEVLICSGCSSIEYNLNKNGRYFQI